MAWCRLGSGLVVEIVMEVEEVANAVTVLVVEVDVADGGRACRIA